MSKKKLIISGVVVVGLFGLWLLFRPELLFINATVSESFPADGGAAPASAALASGMFHGVAHETKGQAAVYQVGGKRVLRLTGFSTSNGPDLRVLLVAAGDAADSDAVKKAGSIELGKLKGNMGDQNYDLPEGADLSKHRAVTIWCNRFGVNFATAPLSAPMADAKPTADPMPATAMPAGEPAPIYTGKFHGVAHETRGQAAIYRLADGKRVLRFTDFQTSNGPDLRVFLIRASDATDSAMVKSAGYTELAPLKGNIGDQNYEIPEGVDLIDHRAVTIWCNRFSVNFATAPLMAPMATASR
jgi:electron transfer DM13